MALQIKIDQGGKPAGIAGQAREDLDLATPVVLSAVGVSASAYKWTFVSRPPIDDLSGPSSAAFSAPSASSTNTTPDNRGTYHVQLEVDQGFGLGARSEDRVRITFYAGPTLNPVYNELPRRIPAPFERLEHNVPDAVEPGGNTEGWAREWERWFRYIESLSGIPDGSANGQVLWWDETGLSAPAQEWKVGGPASSTDPQNDAHIAYFAAHIPGVYWRSALADLGGTSALQGDGVVHTDQIGTSSALMRIGKLRPDMMAPNGSVGALYVLASTSAAGPAELVKIASGPTPSPGDVPVWVGDFTGGPQWGTAPGGTDELVKLSVADATAGYLKSKLTREVGLFADDYDAGGGNLVHKLINFAAGSSRIWIFDTGTADADPGALQMRFDNATQGSATFIYANYTMGQAGDMSTLLLDLNAGDRLFLQQCQVENAGPGGSVSRHKLVRVTGPVVDGGTYVKIPIVVELNGPNDFDVDQEISVGFHYTGGSGVDELVKVTAADVAGDYLEDKLVQGIGIRASTEDPGGAPFLTRKVISRSAGNAISFNFSTTTASGNPGSNNFRLNNATQPSATEMYIDDDPIAVPELDRVLERLRPGTVIRIRQLRSNTDGSEFDRWQMLVVTGDVVDNSGWYTVPISVVQSGIASLEDGEECSFGFYEVPVPEGTIAAGSIQMMWFDGDTGFWNVGTQLTATGYWVPRATISGVGWRKEYYGITTVSAAASSSYNPDRGVVRHAPNDSAIGNQYLLAFDGSQDGDWVQFFNDFITAGFKEEHDDGNKSGTSSLSFADGNKQAVTLTGNWTISSFIFLAVGNYVLKVIQNGTGGYSITWPSNTRAVDGSIDISSAPNSVTIIGIYFDGTNVHLTSAPNSAGSVTTNLV